MSTLLLWFEWKISIELWSLKDFADYILGILPNVTIFHEKIWPLLHRVRCFATVKRQKIVIYMYLIQDNPNEFEF